MSDKQAKIDSYFDELSEAPADQRAALLALIEDEEIRDEVESLLRYSPSGGDESEQSSFRKAVASAFQSAAHNLQNTPAPRFGPYRVTGTLGRGGMGTVYRAVRDDQAFQKEVAVKVLNLAVDSPSVRERFRRERQILAALDHPSIARLLDGGETGDGFSYIVLEYVDGKNIIAHCRDNQLSRRDRLELFMEVCKAVQFAHQNLVVHRDIKPGNILVTRDGKPKLLDFGIAKLLDPAGDRTATDFMALTPHYASPEQVQRGNITTASDVYSLGVLLYEMLAGRPPYHMESSSPSELIRVVCHAEPQNPGLGDDLDNILLMALRKEPERRYASAREFADDIERSLTNQPVRARADTITYRVNKFARRNRLPLIAGLLIVAALVGGIIESQRQARRAERRLQDVRQLASLNLFDEAALRRNASGPTAAREQMVRTALECLERLAAESGEDASLRADLSGAYQAVGDMQGQALGRAGDAANSYRKSIALGETLLREKKSTPAARRALAAAYLGMVDIEARHARMPQSTQFAKQALDLIEQPAGAESMPRDFRVEAYQLIARPFLESGKPMQALAFYRKALQLLEDDQTLPEVRKRFLEGSLHQHISWALKNHGDFAGAMQEIGKAKSIFASIGQPPDAESTTAFITALMGPAMGEASGPLEITLFLATPAERKKALELAEHAHQRDPNNISFDLLATLTRSWVAMDVMGANPMAGWLLFQKNVQSADKMMRTDQESTGFRGNVAIYEAATADMLSKLDPKSALAHSQRAETLLSDTAKSAGMIGWREIEALLLLVSAEVRLEQTDLAERHAKRSLELAQALWPAAKEDLRSFYYIGESYEAIGNVQRSKGGGKAACEAYRKSLATWKSWLETGVSNMLDQKTFARLKVKMSACQ